MVSCVFGSPCLSKWFFGSASPSLRWTKVLSFSPQSSVGFPHPTRVGQIFNFRKMALTPVHKLLPRGNYRSETSLDGSEDDMKCWGSCQTGRHNLTVACLALSPKRNKREQNEKIKSHLTYYFDCSDDLDDFV